MNREKQKRQREEEGDKGNFGFKKTIKFTMVELKDHVLAYGTC